MFRFVDMNENMPSYGSHNSVYTVRYRQLQDTKVLCTTNGVIVSTEILKWHLWSDVSSNETESLILKKKTMLL